MNIVVSISIFENPKKGVYAAMDDFTEKESLRLKQVLANRQLKDQRLVDEHQIKVNQSHLLWAATKDAARTIVVGINDRAGTNLLLWQEAPTNQLEVAAPDISLQHKITVTFIPEEFRLKWNVPSGPKGQYEMTLFVKNNELIWKHFQNPQTAQEAAERLIGALTSTITT